MSCPKHPQWQGLPFCPTCDTAGPGPAVGALIERIINSGLEPAIEALANNIATAGGGKKLNDECEASAMALEAVNMDLRRMGKRLTPESAEALADAFGDGIYVNVIAHFLKAASAQGWQLQKAVQ